MKTPEALTAITAEEDYWQTVYFDDFGSPKKTVVLEKQENNGYTLATVDGTDVNILDQLESLPTKEIPRQQALEMRQRYDYNWAGRGKLRRQAESLFSCGLLRPSHTGALSASWEFDSPKATGCTITITEEGIVSTLIHDPVQLDDFENHVYEMDWHEYELPRHVSYAIHRVKHAERNFSIPKTVYNPLTVVRQVHEWFKVAQAIA